MCVYIYIYTSCYNYTVYLLNGSQMKRVKPVACATREDEHLAMLCAFATTGINDDAAGYCLYC